MEDKKNKDKGSIAMELRISAKMGHLCEVEEAVELIKKIEKEYSCNCTLLEIRID